MWNGKFGVLGLLAWYFATTGMACLSTGCAYDFRSGVVSIKLSSVQTADHPESDLWHWELDAPALHVGGHLDIVGTTKQAFKDVVDTVAAIVTNGATAFGPMFAWLKPPTVPTP